MAQFKHVEVYPHSGWRDVLWVADDPDADAFARASVSIADLYSEALAADPPQNRVGSLRIFVNLGGPAKTAATGSAGMYAVESPIFEKPPSEGFEVARLQLAAGFASIAEQEQCAAALEGIHECALLLARARGWPSETFEAARHHVVNQGFRYRWTSPWKAGPGRRLRARCQFETHPDGMGRMRLEVARAGQDEGATSNELDAWNSPASYKRAARTLRWISPERLSLVPECPPYIDEGERKEFVVEIDVDDVHVSVARP